MKPKRKVRTFRPWPGDRPPPEFLAGDLGYLLPAHMEWKLGKSARTLWRHLLDARGFCAPRIGVRVDLLATRLAMPVRTVERALHRLEEAGLITRHLRRVRQPGWYSNLMIDVWGGTQIIRGKEEVWVTPGCFKWCQKAPGRGGFRGVKVAGVSQNPPKTATSNQGVSGQSGGYKNTSTSTKSLGLPNGKPVAARAAAVSPVINRMMKPYRKMTRAKLRELATRPLPAGSPPGLAPLPAVVEQMLRRKEMQLRHDCEIGPRDVPEWFDPRYVRLRAHEVLNGQLDPITK